MKKRDWASIKRTQRMYADNTHCQNCGKTGERMHRHHLDRCPWNTEEWNVVVLCPRCHAQEHVACGDWGKQGQSKLTAFQVMAIRHTTKVREVAAALGISRSYAYRIRKGVYLRTIRMGEVEFALQCRVKRWIIGLPGGG